MSLLPEENRKLLNDNNYLKTTKIAFKANQGKGFSVYDDATYTSPSPDLPTTVVKNFTSYLTFPTYNDQFCKSDVSVGPTDIFETEVSQESFPKKVNSTWLADIGDDGSVDPNAYFTDPWLTNIHNSNPYNPTSLAGIQTEGFTCNECNGCYDVCAGCFSNCVECTTGCTSACTAGCNDSSVGPCSSCDSCTTSCNTGCTSGFTCSSNFSCTSGCFTTCQVCASCVGQCQTGCNSGCTSGCFEFCTASCADSCNDSSTSCDSCTSCVRCVSTYDD